jgi:epsilon-lactone hydrolase
MSAIASLTTLYLRSRQKRLLQVRHPLTPRRLMEHMRWLPLPAGVQRERHRIAGMPVLRILNTHRSARKGQGLLYIHGGGFTGGSHDTHASFAARLMQTGRFAEVWLPDYRLAPEHVFPAARDDVMAVWQAMAARFAPGQLCVAGESAGGNLALGLAIALRNQNLPAPLRLYLLSPWLDLDLSAGTLSTHFKHDAFCGPHPEPARDWIRRQFSRHYLGEWPAHHPEVSPVHADVHGLPPIYAGGRQ